jgi:hypothetical protein
LRIFKSKTDRAEVLEFIHSVTEKLAQLQHLLTEMAKGTLSTAQKVPFPSWLLKADL